MDWIEHSLAAITPGWVAFKDLVEQAMHLPESAIHVLAGVVLQLLFALIMRRSLRDWAPWLGVLLLELANEVLDLTEVWPGEGDRQLAESVSDVFVTMLLPSLLLLVARLRPQLLTGRR